MKRICLVVLFLCSVFGYTQDTLLHRDTAITAYTAKGIKLSWEKDASTKYAFDDGGNKPKELQKEYGTTKDAEGKEVFIPYKAVLNGKEDVVNAVIEITDTVLNSAEVLFKTLTGKSIPVIQQYKTPNGRKYTLQLKGAYDYAIEEVVAMLVPRDSGANQQVIGSFKLVHLSPKTVNITLVPLDAQAQQKIQGYKEELQKIYDSIGVTFNIKEEPIMDISSIVQGNEIVSEDAEAMSTYSAQQQQINVMYKGQSNDRYVVFITSKRASTGQGGYMRLNGQYGYVYGNADAKTLAHEIGHGVFRLEHPWSKYKTTKNSSNLLLDYKTGGRELCHLDWKQINNPAFKLYAFQTQSEGEAVILDNLIGAVVDITIQISENAYDKYIDKQDVSLWKIRWWPDVAISAGAGFVSSGAGSLAKFAKYATSPRGQKALKIAIEASTDFIINSIADIAKNYINGDDPNYLQTVLMNFVGSSAFATLNNTGIFNKLKQKILPAKKVEITPVVTPSIAQKTNTLRNNITTNTAKNITSANVTKTQVENRILTTANIAVKGDLPSVPIQKKLNEVVGQETKKIETDVAEVVEGKMSKEVDEEIKKEFYINNKQVTEDEFNKALNQGIGKIAKLGEKLNVSEYAISAKNSINDAMSPDHIPSFAALQKNLENKLGRPLKDYEKKELQDEGTTLLYETLLH